MAFNWEDDQDEFRDVPDGVHEDQPQPIPVINAGVMSPKPQALVVQQPVAQQEHDFGDTGWMDDGSQDEEEDYDAVLADANLRIDIASLYKMVMNHDLFSGLDVDERAIETVQRQIRRFAKERMEIMLGMRQETPKEAMVSSPFNDLEVLVLKKMASQMSKGATESPGAAQPQPAAKAALRKEGLNTISAQKAPAKPAPVQKPAAKQAVLQKKPQAPIQRQPRPAAPVVPETAESKPLEKHPSLMSEEERIKRNEEAKARQAGRKAKGGATPMPMPTADQEEMFHTQRIVQSDNPLANTNALSAIMHALNKSKSQ